MHLYTENGIKLDLPLAYPLRSLRLTPFFNRKGRKEDAKFAKKKVRKEKTSHLSPCTLYLFRIILLFFLFPSAIFAGEREILLSEYYQRAVPTIDRFMQRFPHTDRTEPASDFTIFTLFNNIAIIVSANVDLPEEQRIHTATATRLLRIAEEMQDKNPESRTFGNFRWYWNSSGVTDANAAEFALARMLSIYLDTPEPLSEEDRTILYRLLERAVHVSLHRRIHPDYTNIAFYNAIHLILLGQVLDRQDVTQEGCRRLQNITAHLWNHGIFEYNSPAYYPINIDSLQLGYRHVHDAETKQMIHALLELFWTDMSLHWYAPGLHLSGAQSRTYNYLSGGNVHIHRLFAFAGLAPYDHDARYHAVLNSFRAHYHPPPEITQLNEQYPRLITRNWGRDQGQWATLYLFEDIALGTAGAKYDARQNIVQVVDIADHRAGTSAPVVEDFRWVHWQYLPRSYFIADGREDPYGTKLSPTGSGGQQKALHLDALWFGSQRTVDSLGIALYPPETLADPGVINVQSHFVVRKPESVWIDGEPIVLLPNQPVSVGNQPAVFRYQTCAFGIRAVWTRDSYGQAAEVVLVDDGNNHGVYRLTAEHGLAATPQSADSAAVFWLRIGSQLETEEEFMAWQEQFLEARVNRLVVNQNDIDIEVAGQDGVVSVSLTDALGSVRTEPDAPLGILTLDGTELARPILERLSATAQFIKQRAAAAPVMIIPSGTHWEAATGYSWHASADLSGEALTVNHDVSWQLHIERSGEYYLWGRVQTRDAQHDSFWVETAKQLPDGSFMRRSLLTDWHLGVRDDWTWVRLPVPIRFTEGIWQLTLRPREYEGRIDTLFMALDPARP